MLDRPMRPTRTIGRAIRPSVCGRTDNGLVVKHKYALTNPNLERSDDLWTTTSDPSNKNDLRLSRATHRENTIDRMSSEPDRSDERESVAGNPFNEELVGSSSGARGRAPGEAGRIAFFTTDGGTTSLPPDEVLRTAKLLRVEFLARPT